MNRDLLITKPTVSSLKIALPIYAVMATLCAVLMIKGLAVNPTHNLLYARVITMIVYGLEVAAVIKWGFKIKPDEITRERTLMAMWVMYSIVSAFVLNNGMVGYSLITTVAEQVMAIGLIAAMLIIKTFAFYHTAKGLQSSKV